MITFADLLSLVLTFFVLLYAMSSLEDEKWHEISHSLAQRLNYLGSILSWTTGLIRLALYLTPILMLFTGVAPVNKITWELGVLILAYLFSAWAAIKIAGNGFGHVWQTEEASMADFWTQCRCTFRALLNRSRQRFVVTT